MKKLLSILLSILLVVSLAVYIGVTYAPAPAFAQARYGLFVSDAIEETTALVLPAKTWIYGIKIYADENNSWIAIHDCALESATTMTNLIDEIGEATAYDTQVNWYAKPRYATNGITVQMDTGVGFIYYGPQPE